MPHALAISSSIYGKSHLGTPVTIRAGRMLADRGLNGAPGPAFNRRGALPLA